MNCQDGSDLKRLVKLFRWSLPTPNSFRAAGGWKYFLQVPNKYYRLVFQGFHKITPRTSRKTTGRDTPTNILWGKNNIQLKKKTWVQKRIMNACKVRDNPSRCIVPTVLFTVLTKQSNNSICTGCPQDIFSFKLDI